MVVERIAGDGQRFVGAPEQLGRDLLAVDLEREFSVDRSGIAAGQTPDAAAGRRDGVTSE